MAEVIDMGLVLGGNSSEDRGENGQPILLTGLCKKELTSLLLGLIVVQLGVVNEQFVALPVSSMLSVVLALQELSLFVVGFLSLQLLNKNDFRSTVFLAPVVSLQNCKSFICGVDAEQMRTSQIIVIAEFGQSGQRNAFTAFGSTFLFHLLSIQANSGTAVLSEFDELSAGTSSVGKGVVQVYLVWSRKQKRAVPLRISFHIDAFPSREACGIGIIDGIVSPHIDEETSGLRVEEGEESNCFALLGISDQQLLTQGEREAKQQTDPQNHLHLQRINASNLQLICNYHRLS